jgi:Reverse transcriptase (RNA-dependent DNA polymerase).
MRKSKITITGAILAHADDLVIMSRRVQDVEETLVALTNQTKRFELEINEQKTKIYEAI